MARPQIQVQPVPRMGRKLRSPEHTFQISQKPFILQPFCIAPVLPGETLKSMFWQARVVTDPIKNPLIGWWKEYYFFYVKHRDLANREHYEQMMLDQGYDLSSLYTASDVATYHKGSRLNWTLECYKRVVECYFRDDGEAWNAGAIDGLAPAKLNRNAWWSSLTDVTAMIDPIVSDQTPTADITALALERAQRNARFDSMMEMSGMNYEDYLRLAGVKMKREEMHWPELIRYEKAWQYPTNTVDPSGDGSVSSAVSWSISERADKDRFFREPGFILGITCTRPKVYLKDMVGSAAHMLDDAFSWLPALLRDDPRTSLKLEDNAVAAAEGLTNDFYWDTRDLFLYGDQFIGGVYDPDATAGINAISLPSAAAGRVYVVDADIDSLFVTADTACFVREDGIVKFNIATPEGVDYTPTSIEGGTAV